MSWRAAAVVASFLVLAVIAFGMVAASESPDVMEPPLTPQTADTAVEYAP